MTLVSQDDPLPDFDAYCPLSLQYALGTTLETVISDAYLSCLRRWLIGMRNLAPEALRVGLVWSGRKELKTITIAVWHWLIFYGRMCQWSGIR